MYHDIVFGYLFFCCTNLLLKWLFQLKVKCCICLFLYSSVYVRDHESRNSLLGDLSSATVYISLLDSNDNSPSFVNPQESINILEVQISL